MNYSMMTFREILRIAEPQTELEHILMERFEDELVTEIQEATYELAEIADSEAQARVLYLESVLDEHKIKYIQ